MLETCTWDQAAILMWWPATAFDAVGIPEGTVRSWARQGLIKPVAKGPNGYLLYPYEDVVRCRDRPKRRAGRPPGLKSA